MPAMPTVEEILRRNTDRLLRHLQQELEIERDRLKEKLHARKLEQIFIEERLYKQIEEKINYKAVISAVRQGLVPFSDELVRKVTKEDVERLLEIKIRRISRFDINRQLKEIQTIEKAIGVIENHLLDMVLFTVNYLKNILKKHGKHYPRKSELRKFDEVDARKAALSNLHVAYQRESGFLGSKVKLENTKKDIELACSEYDRLLLIFKNGMYKVISVSDKLFIGSDLLWLGVVHRDVVFNVIYRSGLENLSYVKRFTTPKFIINREYRLFPEHKRSIIQLMVTGDKELKARARVSFVPSGRAKYNRIELEFADYLIKGATAKGKRIGNRTVRSVANLTGKPKQEKPTIPSLPGFSPKVKDQK
jgi:topoisomerase-4 subunit A